VVAVLKENGGQASAFNAGFAASSGEVVLLLDADDWFLPTKVSAVMAALAPGSGAGWCFHPLEYDGGPGVEPSGRFGRVDARAAMRRGADHGVFAPATSGLAFRRSLLERILPMPEAFRVAGASGGRGTAADAYVKVAALGLAPGIVRSERLAVQRLHGANAYTGTRWADPRRAALELLIASELRERWPELRPYALRKGLGGLQRLAALGAREVDADTLAVARAFRRASTPAERVRIAAHSAWWRVRAGVGGGRRG
jgi:glycosyltransferase involved in cell wall biosynthesis